MGRKRGWMWEHISEHGKGAKCKNCDKIYQRTTNCCSIKAHLFHAHGIYDEEDNLRWIENTRDKIWQYFSKRAGYSAQCNVDYCKRVIKYAHNISNLTCHLESLHEDIVKTKREEIACTSLTPHFKLTNSVAACNYCNDRINIFQGIDALRSHFDTWHNINKDEGERNSGSHDNILTIRKSLGNQEGQQSQMLQQSVYTENYAGPSFDYNNASRQYLGNQEGQQSQMLQQSVYTENYAGPSFDYNNASRQYLGNQEGQQSLILQQSVDTENYAGPSFDYNNASRQYLGNQGGQQSQMLQQSVYTENYAGPSFDYNNASRQYLGNQEGQQGLMLQQSVDSENYVAPSFYHNNTPRQFFGNQEGQQGSVDNYNQQGHSQYNQVLEDLSDYMIDP